MSEGYDIGWQSGMESGREYAEEEMEEMLDLLSNWYMGTNPRPINVNGVDTFKATEALLEKHGRLQIEQDLKTP